MSRVAKKPIAIPSGVEVSLHEAEITVKGPKGSMILPHRPIVNVKKENNELLFSPKGGSAEAEADAGSIRALVGNMIIGVTKGFERKLLLVGVGFKAQVQGKVLNLALGFSHPVKFVFPEGITVETPTQTEIMIKGIDKHLVGQIAAKIRAFRPPEPYKGKGVKYDNEIIVKKEGKKK
jgi:large subunit ribosomal protein L6